MKFCRFELFLSAFLGMLLMGCDNDHLITIDRIEIVEGTPLFENSMSSVVLTHDAHTVDIEYSADQYVTLLWVTSQDISVTNKFNFFTIQGKPFIKVTGECYFPNLNVDDYLENEIVSQFFAFPEYIHSYYLFKSDINYWHFKECDWAAVGVDIVDTHKNKDVGFDNCELVYRGWLHLTLGGTDEEHRFIQIKSIAEAPEDYGVAHLFFSTSGKFVNNMITVTQQGYSPAE